MGTTDLKQFLSNEVLTSTPEEAPKQSPETGWFSLTSTRGSLLRELSKPFGSSSIPRLKDQIAHFSCLAFLLSSLALTAFKFEISSNQSRHFQWKMNSNSIFILWIEWYDHCNSRRISVFSPLSGREIRQLLLVKPIQIAARNSKCLWSKTACLISANRRQICHDTWHLHNTSQPMEL